MERQAKGAFESERMVQVCVCEEVAWCACSSAVVWQRLPAPATLL